MPVFKVFFKIMGRYKVLVIMYVCIFMGISITIGSINGKEKEEKYETTRVKVSVIDRDGSELSKGLKDYIKEYNNLIPLKDEENEINDALYWRNSQYIIIVPKNFEEDVKAGKSVNLITRKIDYADTTRFVDEELNQFISLLDYYLISGYSISDGIKKVRDNLKNKVQVSLVKGDKKLYMDSTGYYFQYAPYVMISVCITIITMIMIFLYEDDIKKRCVCSSMSLKQQNKELALASVLFTLMIFVVVVIGGIVMSKGSLLKSESLIFYMVNSFAFSMISMSVAFVFGVFLNSGDSVGGVCNVVGLGFCFLGGVFVPLEILPKGVLNAAHFVPSYWYVKANEITAYMDSANSEFIKEFCTYVGIEMLFAAAFLAIGLLCSKKRVIFG